MAPILFNKFILNLKPSKLPISDGLMPSLQLPQPLPPGPNQPPSSEEKLWEAPLSPSLTLLSVYTSCLQQSCGGPTQKDLWVRWGLELEREVHAGEESRSLGVWKRVEGFCSQPLISRGPQMVLRWALQMWSPFPLHRCSGKIEGRRELLFYT